MTAVFVAIGSAATFGGLALWLNRRLHALPSKQKKALVKKTVSGIFVWFEERGLLPRTPAFDPNYLRHYPALRILEENHAVIRAECLDLLRIKDRLTDMKAMGGNYTQAGIHTIQWKTFVLKSGDFVEANCRLAPRTAALVRDIPDAFTIFFSVLEPRQRIAPHWGYYKGFLRYHLGVVIPNNNANGECFLRVNGNLEDNAKRDTALVDRGEVYHWKEGAGIVFDDNYLHDAGNDSDEVRVVLWIDLRRKMPFYLEWFNSLCLAVARRDTSMKEIQQNALVEA
jgi:beta-hydroxylase